jgi:predicted CoA-substrate-specific enzyme activase
MIVCGLDIGSRTVKLVVFKDGELSDWVIEPIGVEPFVVVNKLIKDICYDKLVITGYGRHIGKEIFNHCEVITEIKAFAMGAYYLFPKVKTVLDIGGQDCKVIKIKDKGLIDCFEMNDRCAAGTGRFLENMANVLGVRIDELPGLAFQAKDEKIKISSICTVFAESEVISLIARNINKYDISLALHKAILIRVLAMINRVKAEEQFIFGGGGALNNCLKLLLEKELKMAIIVPEHPQLLGAIGAAVYGNFEIS